MDRVRESLASGSLQVADLRLWGARGRGIWTRSALQTQGCFSRRRLAQVCLR
jgi:hypothetical protein